MTIYYKGLRNGSFVVGKIRTDFAFQLSYLVGMC